MLSLSLSLWVKDERALHIKSLWYNPVTQSSQSSPQTSNSAPSLSQEWERGGRESPAYLRETLSKHTQDNLNGFCCALYTLPCEKVILSCHAYTLTSRWNDPHTSLCTHTPPPSTPLKKLMWSPFNTSTNRVLFIPATASWRYWPWYWLMGEKARRNCKIHQGDLVIYCTGGCHATVPAGSGGDTDV